MSHDTELNYINLENKHVKLEELSKILLQISHPVLNFLSTPPHHKLISTTFVFFTSTARTGHR